MRRRSVERAPRSRLRLTAYPAAWVGLAACGEPPPPDLPPIGPIDEHVKWVQALPFEGIPPPAGSLFSFDDRRGLLAVEFELERILSWEVRGGALRPTAGVGIRGVAPPVTARWLPDGRILVSHIDGEVVVLDRSGEELDGRARTTVAPLFDAVWLDRQLLLLAGRSGPPVGPQLHLWRADGSELVASFFEPPVRVELRPVAVVAGRPAAAVREDSIAAIYSLADSLWVLDREGRVADAMGLPFRRITVAEGAPEEPDPGALRRWSAETWFPMEVFWLADGTLLVQVGRGDPVAGWSTALLALDREGRPLFELEDSPRLVATSGDRLYFLDPDEETSPRLLVGRLRG